MEKVVCKQTWPTSPSNKEHQMHWHNSFHPQIKGPFWWENCNLWKIACNIKPDKEEHCRTLLTVGGNLLDYTGNLSTPTASVTTEKCLLNIVISTPKARALTADIKHFYLNNHLPEPEYLKLHISVITDEIITVYNLQNLQDEKVWYYIKIYKGMYGLKQSGIIANQELQ